MGVSGHATIAAVTVALVTKILDQNPVRIETSSGIFEASWTRTRTTIELLWIRTLPFLLLRPPDDAARVLGIQAPDIASTESPACTASQAPVTAVGFANPEPSHPGF